jgi:NADH-quinone oxidoreductase subunit C
MDTERIIQELKEKFKSDIDSVLFRSSKRVTVDINPEILLNMAEYLLQALEFRFIIASALHTRKGFEIYYHFSLDGTGLVMNLHVILDSENPEIESLSNMLEAANWIEREMHELFGINFLNHPNQEKLLSEGNWAEGVYPYRKNFIANIPEDKE